MTPDATSSSPREGLAVSLSPFALRATPDAALLEALKRLATRSAELEADLLVHLGEVDARGLALERGYRSLHAYCVEVLHFSEAVAFHRITAARAVRRFPEILERIRGGELHLSGLRLLIPHLTPEACAGLLDLARHQSKRAIEERLADRAPKPDAPAQVRRLPEPAVPTKPLALDAAPAVPPPPAPAPIVPRRAVPPPSPEPLGESRYRIQFTARAETHAKLRRAQALLRHQIPDGDLARIFDRALTPSCARRGARSSQRPNGQGRRPTTHPHPLPYRATSRQRSGARSPPATPSAAPSWPATAAAATRATRSSSTTSARSRARDGTGSPRSRSAAARTTAMRRGRTSARTSWRASSVNARPL
jgi:hypothetical protein